MKFANKNLRHELKYYLHDFEYHTLRTKTRGLLSLDPYSQGPEGYHIRSLYFDSLKQSSYYEKINGIFHRKKYRIRIYNRSDAYIMLERKSKYNEFICKESSRLTRPQYEMILNGEIEFLLKGDTLQQEFHADLKDGHMKPSIIVDYIREAYIYPISNVRITFDKELSAGINTVDIFEPDIVTNEILEKERLIMEVKFNSFMPSHIQSMIDLNRFQRSAISKYVLCLAKKMYGSY
ncbi:polyphosphate polymerase domain-containing protein [Marinicrinis sediminis]|uniref:Polyphosphate polymerase domain-containing protein n=1 Tax=Marinicrinis sediminis TaxID=1652465 RepID=A0ABW5R6T1_9BACL